MSAPGSDWATVSVLMPVRNEEAFIAESLGAVLTQPRARHEIEVLVVDGQSTDATRDVVERTANTHGFTLAGDRVPGRFLPGTVTIVDNPDRIAPAALNRGLALSGGQVIARVDGHSRVADDYLDQVRSVLAETGAACVGGTLHTVALSAEAEAIAVATSSPIGVGNVTHKVGGGARAVDSLAFPSWPRETFERVGGFDEELVRNQDDEHTFRILQDGGLVWFDPRIEATYFSRSSLRRLGRQHFEYGMYKVRVAQKRGGFTSIRHLVPGGFVGALVVGVLWGLLRRDPRPLGLVGVPYTVAVVGESVRLGRRHAVSGPGLAAAFVTLHVSYGSGFWVGVWRFRRHHRALLSGRR